MVAVVQTIIAFLILSIVGVVLGFAVSGFLQVLLVVMAGLLVVVFVQRPRTTSSTRL